MTAVRTPALPIAIGVELEEVALDRLDEASLLTRASAGRRDAFAELVRRHQAKVRALLQRLCSDRTLADDLAQEVFLRAYRGLVGFEGRASFGTWLYRISYNVYLNHSTRVRRFSGLPEGYDNEAAAPEDGTSAPRADLRTDLETAIRTLPPRYHAVVVLFYRQELSYPEIAEILELPLGTVKTHLHRAKRLLRAALEGWDGADEPLVEDEPA
jgi:RNA polymerase sigma-70 factor (ECF subfamily)